MFTPIAVCLYCSYYLNYGPAGAFWAITLAEILIAIIAIICFKKGELENGGDITNWELNSILN